jgi:lauroyl/myristoyl acyltransferase
LKRVVLGVLRWLARRWPHGAVVAADALATLSRPVGFGIDDRWLATVFPELAPRERRVVRQATWRSFLKGEAVEAGVRRRKSLRDYPRLVPNPALDELRPPFVIASFHVGPYQALGAVQRALPGPRIAVTRERIAGRSDIALLHEGDDEWQRAHTFHRTLSGLRSGGVALLLVDGLRVDNESVPTIEVPLLGRSLRLARGAFALARIAGVPIVPLAARWEGSAMAVTVGDPVSPELGEEGMAAAVGAWIEGYLRERPGEISKFILDLLRPPLPL